MEDTISPLDGRYYEKTKELRHYFSEKSFFKYRLYVEIKYFLICIVFFASCSKEGEGGSAVISGIVKKEVIAPNGNLIETVPAINKDVFIKFGDSEFVNEDVKTNELGNFEFPFLRKGDYSIFVYSDCVDCDSGKEVRSHSVVNGGHNLNQPSTANFYSPIWEFLKRF